MPEKVADMIDYWAAKTGRSKSEFVREAVRSYVSGIVNDKSIK